MKSNYTILDSQLMRILVRECHEHLWCEEAIHSFKILAPSSPPTRDLGNEIHPHLTSAAEVKNVIYIKDFQGRGGAATPNQYSVFTRFILSLLPRRIRFAPRVT